jgi:hypothetical protein
VKILSRKFNREIETATTKESGGISQPEKSSPETKIH